MSTGPTPLDVTLAYAARGWRVLPVHGAHPDGSCRCGSDHVGSERNVGKHPKVQGGAHAATTDPQQIRAWWGSDPEASVAVATGEASDLLVLDVDGDEGQASLRQLEAEFGPLPTTVVQVTGSGGEQYFFRHVQGPKNSVKVRPGLDVRTEGGYVIVPPSLHRCGRRYEWDAGQHPDEIEVAVAPQWLVEVMTGPKPEAEGPPVDVPTEPQPENVVDRARAYLAKVPGAVSGEGGHDDTYRVACQLFQKFGLSMEQARELLAEWNDRCDPPWSAAELEHKIVDAAKAPRRHESVVGDEIDPAKVKRLPPASRDEAPPADAEADVSDGVHIAPVDPDFALERADEVELARELQKRIRPDAKDLVFDEGSFYAYVPERGIWAPIYRSRLVDALSDYSGVARAGTQPLKVRFSAASGALQFLRAHLDRPGFFGSAARAIGFLDGTLFLDDTGTLELRPHHRDHRLRSTYDFAWADAGECPLWLGHLDELLGSAWDGADRIRVLREHTGASLLGLASAYQHVIALIGVGANGKSFVLLVIVGIAPKGTVCAIPPHTWTDEYRLAMLAGKLINVVNELPRADIVETEVFKAIVTGEPTTARHIREAPFTLQSVAGHFFAGNAMPGSSDSSVGYWRRWIVIPFENSIPEERQVADLHKKILAAERPAIVRWALEGAADLVKRGYYERPPSSTIALGAKRDASLAVEAFLGELAQPTLGTGTGTQSTDLHLAYVAWCQARGLTPVSQVEFGLRMKSRGTPSHRRSSGNYYPFTLRRSGPYPGPASSYPDATDGLWDGASS